MAILVDYSQIAKGILLEFVDELKISTEQQVTGIVRHVMLNTLKSYKRKFGPEYGEVIICLDSSNVWRRDFFPEYKYSRREKQKDSDIDWDFIYKVLGMVAEEIVQFVPYRVLKVERTEADDIIGVVTKYIIENNTTAIGLIEESEPVLVISSDKDFKYLYKYKGYRQWSPLTKAFVELDKGVKPEAFLNELICRGDKSDGVPSVLSPDDQFVVGARQKSLYEPVVQSFIEMGRAACKDEFKVVKKVEVQTRFKALEEKHWDRNNLMINHEAIPDQYKQAIIENYKTATCVKNKLALLQYLVASNCKMLASEIEDF